MANKSFKKDTSVKNGKPPPSSPSREQVFLAGAVIQAGVLSSAGFSKTWGVLGGFLVDDVLMDKRALGSPVPASKVSRVPKFVQVSGLVAAGGEFPCPNSVPGW